MCICSLVIVHYLRMSERETNRAKVGKCMRVSKEAEQSVASTKCLFELRLAGRVSCFGLLNSLVFSFFYCYCYNYNNNYYYY